MKLRKRLAAVLLSAVMILTGLTACDGTTPAGPAELTWQNSRTKQYFDAKGITAQEYTLTADMMASGQKVELKSRVSVPDMRPRSTISCVWMLTAMFT